MDLEVNDGLDKLRDLGLLRATDDGRLTAVPVDDVKRHLDQRWDPYFQYD